MRTAGAEGRSGDITCSSQVVRTLKGLPGDRQIIIFLCAIDCSTSPSSASPAYTTRKKRARKLHAAQYEAEEHVDAAEVPQEQDPVHGDRRYTRDRALEHRRPTYSGVFGTGNSIDGGLEREH